MAPPGQSPAPAWTILPNGAFARLLTLEAHHYSSANSSDPATSTSEDDSRMSSQDMRDEIEPSPPIMPRKRKPSASEQDRAGNRDVGVGRSLYVKKARLSHDNGKQDGVAFGGSNAGAGARQTFRLGVVS